MAKDAKVVSIEDRVALLEVDVRNLISALDDVPRKQCVKASHDEKTRLGLIKPVEKEEEDKHSSVKEKDEFGRPHETGSRKP